LRIYVDLWMHDTLFVKSEGVVEKASLVELDHLHTVEDNTANETTIDLENVVPSLYYTVVVLYPK
jgi:hypothetical protein